MFFWCILKQKKPTSKPVQTAIDEDCSLPINARPCKCFIYYDICSNADGCHWNINGNEEKCDNDIDNDDIIRLPPTKKPTTNRPTYIPTITPTFDPTEQNIELCCNAFASKNNAVCKVIDNENECSNTLKKNKPICYWDKNNCLNEPCIGRKGDCNSNKDCCSEVCIRFRGITNCTQYTQYRIEIRYKILSFYFI